ncbi:MAG: hypothetical protein IIT93_00875, partial [Paludibacteraceae bacterium]|nr:hypothetical protein [Paludibacteraceae bacterium]
AFNDIIILLSDKHKNNIFFANIRKLSDNQNKNLQFVLQKSSNLYRKIFKSPNKNFQIAPLKLLIINCGYTNGNGIIKKSLTLRAAKNGRTEFSYEKICIAVLHKLLGCVE